MKAGTLAETQRLFHRLVTAPEPVPQAMERLAIPEREIERIFRGDARLDAVERVGIYADMYFFRLHDVVAECLPRTRAAMAEDGFHDLMVDYLTACPPGHPSAHEAARRLSSYLSGHPAAAERPWLAELAALEWHDLELHSAPDAEAVRLEDLQSVPPDELGDVLLKLVPAARVATFEHSFDSWWQRESKEPPRRAAEALLVWRRGLVVEHRRLEPLEARALARLGEGARFGEICELAAQTLPEEGAVRQAFELLVRWVADGILDRAAVVSMA